MVLLPIPLKPIYPCIRIDICIGMNPRGHIGDHIGIGRIPIVNIGNGRDVLFQRYFKGRFSGSTTTSEVTVN